MALGTVGEVVSAEVAAGVVSEAEASEESSSGGMTSGSTTAAALAAAAAATICYIADCMAILIYPPLLPLLVRRDLQCRHHRRHQ